MASEGSGQLAGAVGPNGLGPTDIPSCTLYSEELARFPGLGEGWHCFGHCTLWVQQ